MAAAQVRVLEPAALLDRLGDHLDLGGGSADLPERQRTLRATLDWSYQLLNAEERALLSRLSVFAGGWTIEAAEAVGENPLSRTKPTGVLGTLSSLVAKSLGLADEAATAGPRFRMLGAVRAYAYERLVVRGEREPALNGLFRIVEDFAVAAGAGLRTSYRVWAARVDDERDNIRAAWRHALDADRADIVYPHRRPALLLLVPQPANVNLVDQEGLAYCLDGFAVIARTEGQPQADVHFQDEWAAGTHLRLADALRLADETTGGDKSPPNEPAEKW